MKQSHYALLGVPEDADHQEIRDAYRAKMRTSHPDVAETGPDHAYRLNAAYSILSNPMKRKEYDRELERERNEKRVVIPNTQGKRHHRHAGPVNTAERFYARPPRIVWLLLLAIFLNLVLLAGLYFQGGMN